MSHAPEKEEAVLVVHSLSRSRANEIATALGHIYSDIRFSVSPLWSKGHAVHAVGDNLNTILDEVKDTAEHLSANE